MMNDAFRAPDVDTLSVKKLIGLAQKGVIRVPSFQRPLRWTPRDRQLLLDSILRGYPIGTVLFWKKPGAAGPVKLGPVMLEGREEAGALWVVDGQQRIVTLVASALMGATEPAYPAFGLFIDLDEWTVLNDAVSRRNQPRFLPVHEAMNNVRLSEWVREHNLSGERATRAFEAGERLRDFEMPTITVETQDESVLRVIFDRINSGGRRLKADDIFSALHFAGTPTESLGDLKHELEDQGRGQVAEAALHKATLAVLDIDPTRPLPKRLRAPGGLSGKLPEVKDALSLALDFLADSASIWRFELLPHALAFPILAKFFARHPRPHERNRMLLVRWLWRGLVHDVYQRGSEPLRHGIAAIGDRESASVQRLLQLVPRDRPPLITGRLLDRAQFKNARIKMTLLAMFAARSNDPGDHIAKIIAAGEKLPKRGKKPKRSLLEMLPRVFTASDFDPGDVLRHSIANRLAIPHPEGEMSAGWRQLQLYEEFQAAGVEWPVDELVAEGAAPLLVKRADILSDQTTAFVDRLARWDESDRGPLDDDEDDA